MQLIDCSNPDVIGLFTLSIVCVRLRQNNVLLDRSVNRCETGLKSSPMARYSACF